MRHKMDGAQVGKLVRNFYSLARDQKDFTPFLKMERLLNSLSAPTPSYRLEYGKAAVMVLRLGGLTGDRQEDWISLARDIDSVLHARGYRYTYEIATRQEHALSGLSAVDVRKFLSAESRYTPLGVLKGELAVEEARRARELSAVIRNYPIERYFVTGNGSAHPTMGMLSLEALDKNGMTVQDPRALDKEKFDDAFADGKKLAKAFGLAEMKLEKVRDFPFRRGVRPMDEKPRPDIVRDL